MEHTGIGVSQALDFIRANDNSQTVKIATLQHDRNMNPSEYIDGLPEGDEAVWDAVAEMIVEYGSSLLTHGDVYTRIAEDDDSDVFYLAQYDDSVLARTTDEWFEWCYRHYVEVGMTMSREQITRMAEKIRIELGEQQNALETANA